MVTNAFYSIKEEFHSPGNSFADEQFLFTRCDSKDLLNEKRCLFGKKIVNLISSLIWISIKNFSKAKASCYQFAMIQKIPRQLRQQLWPKPKSSGLEVEANLDCHDKNFYCQCSNINKQGIYLQVNYQEIISRLFPIDSS